MKRKLLGSAPTTTGDDNTTRFSGHLQVCPKIKIKCEFYEHGCTELVKREDLAQHHANNPHRHLKLVEQSMEMKVNRMEQSLTLKINRLEQNGTWFEGETTWCIPLPLLGQIAATRAPQVLSLQSATFLVGNFRSNLMLHASPSNVCISVYVNTAECRPCIRDLRVDVGPPGCGVLNAQEQPMNQDPTNAMYWTISGTLQHTANDNGLSTIRAATREDLVQWAYPNGQLVLRASFRLKGEYIVGCSGGPLLLPQSTLTATCPALAITPRQAN